MLAITLSTRSEKLIPNILPCRIHHSGPVKVSKRHWNPNTTATLTTTLPSSSSHSSENNDPPRHQTSSTVYFRGRKLHGRKLRVPKGHRGVVLQKTDRLLAPAQAPPQQIIDGEEDDDVEDNEPAVEVKLMEELATFEEMMVWGHETVPEDGDEYVRGVEDWIGMAEAVGFSPMCIICGRDGAAC